MFNDHPGLGPENVEGGESVPKSETPPAVIEAKGQAEAAGVKAAQTAGEQEVAALEPMMDFVMSKSDLDAGTCFGIPIPDGLLPVEVAKILCRIKAEQGLPIESLPDPMVGKMLKDNLSEAQIAAVKKEEDEDTKDDEVETEAVQDQEEDAQAAADKDIDSREEYLSWLKNNCNGDILIAVKTAESLPTNGNKTLETEKARLLQFNRILGLSKTPQDRQIISQGISHLNPRQMPTAQAFIRSVVFSPPASEGSEGGVSEATQIVVAEAFGMERPPYIKTGGGVLEEGTEMVTNPETGEQVPKYPEDKPLPIRPGVESYVDASGDLTVRVEAGDHIIEKNIAGWRADDVTLLTEVAGFWAGAEGFGATSFVEDVYKIDFSGVNSAALDPIKLTQIRQQIDAMFGGMEGYDGEILDVRNKAGLLHYQMRMVSGQDSAKGWEEDREGTNSMMRQLGMHDADGNINMNVMKEFGRLSQETYLSAEMNNARLHQALFERFPDQVEPPETGESV